MTTDPAVIEALAVARSWLDAQHDYEVLPSISVAIVHDQELVWSGAVGMAELDAQRPATSTTLYSVCSISKLFTSVAMMQLQQYLATGHVAVYELLVLLAAMPALQAQKVLIPLGRRFDVVGKKHRLRTHRSTSDP